MTSCNGWFRLTVQPDGSLWEFFNPDGSVPSIVNSTGGGTRYVMQTDGNFVELDANSNQIWSVFDNPQMQTTAGAYLIVQDDGFISIRDPAYNPFPGGTSFTTGADPSKWALGPGG